MGQRLEADAGFAATGRKEAKTAIHPQASSFRALPTSVTLSLKSQSDISPADSVDRRPAGNIASIVTDSQKKSTAADHLPAATAAAASSVCDRRVASQLERTASAAVAC